VEIHGYDFKGNPLATSRRTIRNEAVRPFLGTAAYTAFVVDWQRTDAETHYLETQTYRSDTAFDALNRPKRVVFPEDNSGERKLLLPFYNRAGALESVALQSPNGVPPSGGQGVGVEHIGYNAKGQRTLLALANGLMTRYEYDPHTFRLVRLRTEKYRRENGYTFAPDGGLLQDLAYRYDLAGNITQIQDRGTGKGINGIFAFDRDFTYDAIYRLLSGTGIEHSAYTHAGEPWLEMLQHHNNDLTQTRHYRQRYTYDPAGNILELAHRNLDGEAGHYTRSFSVQSANNRLQSMQQNGLTYTYTYDPNGNMTREATNRRYHWNHSDQLTRFRNQTDGSAPTVDACYLYGADGIRVKKVVLNGGGLLKTTTYIGEVFEYCTRGEQAYNMIHLMDGEQRIALLRVGAPFSGDESQDPALQYILGDHLDNSSMTANAAGALIHREEFTPYGETSFGGYGEKRYRFTGKERDEESGLSYHRARYYAGWLGRWVSADPAGMVDGVNLFRYSTLNPERFFDTYGTDSRDVNSSNKDSAVITETELERQVTPLLKRMPSSEDANILPDEQKKREKAIIDRRNKLISLFDRISPEESLSLIHRLSARISGDILSERFKDILATPTRKEILGILHKKYIEYVYDKLDKHKRQLERASRLKLEFKRWIVEQSVNEAKLKWENAARNFKRAVENAAAEGSRKYTIDDPDIERINKLIRIVGLATAVKQLGRDPTDVKVDLKIKHATIRILDERADAAKHEEAARLTEWRRLESYLQSIK
jgi:RHS repeat-associated protein